MIPRGKLLEYGLQKMAEGMLEVESGRAGVQMNPFRPPSQPQVAEAQSYGQAGLLGALAGAATGVAGGSLFKRNPLAYGAMGAGTGLLAAIVRNFDQRSDPPGLSPVYTLPAGASLGALTGAVSGAALGKLTGFGVIPGALVGAGGGATGGTIVSGMV